MSKYVGEEETVNGDIEQLDDMDVENLSLNSDKEQMEQPLPSDMDIEVHSDTSFYKCVETIPARFLSHLIVSLLICRKKISLHNFIV